MTILASDVISRARNQLVDVDTVQRWTDAEFLQHISDALRTISIMDPSTVAKVAVVKLLAGTRQKLPADGNALLSITRNMGLDGLTPARVIRVIRRDIIDDQNANWHTDPQVTNVYNYVYDPLDAKAFYVYPPSNGVGYIEINYQYTPPELSTTTAIITLPDAYLVAITDYVLMRAHQKDGDFAAGREKSAMYMSAFKMFVESSDAADLENNPNLQTVPFNPSVKGSAK